MILTIDTEKPTDVAYGLSVLRALDKTARTDALPRLKIVTCHLLNSEIADMVLAMGNTLRSASDQEPTLVSSLFMAAFSKDEWDALPKVSRQRLGIHFGQYVRKSSDLSRAGSNEVGQVLYVSSPVLG